MRRIISMSPFERSRRREEVMDLQGLSLSRSRDFYANVQIKDSWFQYCEKRVYLLDEKVVSNVDIFTREIWYGHVPLRIGDIGNVCTHPDYRRRGLATQLIKNTLAYMRNKRYDLSALFGTWSGYQRLGWVILPGTQATVKTRELLLDETYKARKFKPEDFSELVRTYEADKKYVTGSTVRTEEYWAKHIGWLTGQPNVLVVIEHEKQTIAYCLCGIEAKALNVREIISLQRGVEPLMKIFACIINFAHETGCETITTGVLSLGHPYKEALDRLETEVVYKENRGVMIRIVSLWSLLEKIRPQLERRLQGSSLDSYEGSLTFQCHGCVITMNIREAKISLERDGIGEVLLPLDQCSAIQLILGSLNRTELRDITDAREYFELLNNLFPVQPIHWAHSHF